MGWPGIKLSVATRLITGIVIELTEDDAIHYLVRYSREFRKDLNRDRALRAFKTGSEFLRIMVQKSGIQSNE